MHLLRLPATSVKSVILLQHDQGPNVDPEQMMQFLPYSFEIQLHNDKTMENLDLFKNYYEHLQISKM